MSPRQCYRGQPPLSGATVDSACGPIAVLTDGREVLTVELGRPAPRRLPADRLARAAAGQLRAYLRRGRRDFDLPMRIRGTPFARAVLDALATIPFGETRTYGELARIAGRPRAARAVGQVLGANRLPILLPCHRVVAAGGRPGGFGAGLAWKRFLLAREGVPLD